MAITLLKNIKASLFVSTYNMPKHLELVCAGLERQSTNDFEVYFCDDGSGSDTAKIISNFKSHVGFPVHHVWQENRGFRKCAILNTALRQAKGSICIFLDGDCIPHRHFIQDHLNYSEKGYYLAGRRVELGPELSQSLSPELVTSGFFNYPNRQMILSCFKGDSQYLNRCFRLPWAPLRSLFNLNQVVDLKGCNYSVSRESLLAINGFDEAYEGYGREDTDIEIRLQNLGLEIKSLKGVALQFHVWHPRRDFTPVNDDRLDEARKTKRIRCEKGITS